MLTLLLLIPALSAENWPMWRGATSDGASSGPTPLTKWTKADVRWRIDLPEPGNSTPVVWGNSVFVTQPNKAGGERQLICFDRATGRQKWIAKVPYKDDEPTHATNPYASASPATDGERVIAWFGAAGLFAYDMNGKELWKRDLGRQRHIWGYGTSPVVHGGQVFLNFGPGDRAFLIALDKKTGKTMWQTDVPAGAGAKFRNWSPEDMYGSWSTPVVMRINNREELIVTHPKKLVSYDPPTGKVHWTSEGLGDLVYPSPVAAVTDTGETAIIAASGFSGPAMAVKPGGQHFWRMEKSKNSIGSAVSKDGYLYWIDNSGIAQAIKISNGEVMWTQRLPRQGDDNGVWSSPVLNNGNVFVMNKSGAVVVFRADPRQFEAIATNALNEPSNSSVVISDGELFLRTHAGLWCIRAGAASR